MGGVIFFYPPILAVIGVVAFQGLYRRRMSHRPALTVSARLPPHSRCRPGSVPRRPGAVW
jgi:hypothetical protein